jgi:phosphohistidine phosphatase
VNLLLLRHSNAEDVPPPGQVGDQFRRLTTDGREKARIIGRAIQRIEPGITRVLTSPAARALETAEDVVSQLEPRPPLEPCAGLWIGGDIRGVVTRLRPLESDDGGILLVGHEPDLGRLVARLLTGGVDLRLVFKKGGLCKLSVRRLTAGRCATLEWLLTPRQLRMLAE